MRWLLAFVAVLALALPASALAVTVDEVARDVKCPTCSTPLNVSEAPVALDMKEFIAERIAEGDSKQEIIDALVEEFGPSVLAVPPKEGFDLLAWLVPLVAVVVGLMLIPLLVLTWRRRSPSSEPIMGTTSPDELARLEDELRRRSEG
ncbi:MAG: cytochrome c-type biogenesis protein CcmH [Thermoleophilia bacterium]|nr:cytochrome c-type biogenesis protein CcmH [Thermoleophilia bacterium]MDH3725117.1 cytochrome c-type biogenesis protein CcmH [Thermoleophilia bacterium]